MQQRNNKPNEKITTFWKKIMAHNVISKGLESKIYRQVIQLSNQNKQTTQTKNGHFSKEDIQMTEKHIKGCSTLLNVREMQIKTTMKYYLIPVRMAIIKKSMNNKCWRGCGEKGNLLHCWWECKLVQPIWRTVWVSLKNKNRATI